jgi:methionyl-tRNA synthetase
MNTPKRYMITAALPYANGPLHIGHVAGAYIPSDIYVKYLRLKGKDVCFVCGTDEHGAAITLRAKQENITPQEIVDKYHNTIKTAFEKMNIDFDIFHRTSAKIHHETASEFFLDLYNKDVFVEKTTEQYYDEEFNQFLADRYIKGTCPKCANEEAYGDQCEKCGSTLSPLELVNPLSTLSGKTPSLKSTTHWFLPLDKDQEWLEKWIYEGLLDGKQHHDPKTWKKNVVGQIKSWLQDGLRPRAITRDLDWGVDVPQSIKGSEGKKLYVWLDAPIGYISATKQLAKDGKIDSWEKYWQDEDTELIHFLGKDNIVFHSIIFPSILKAKGNYILPKNVPANEFMNLEGDKISTSKDWAVWVHEYVDAFPDKIDEMRYVLTANSPESKDSEFTWEDFQRRVNTELVATLGNFVNRIAVLTHKYYDGVLVNDETAYSNISEDLNAVFLTLDGNAVKEEIDSLIENFKFREALDLIMLVARNANKFLTEKEPWKTIKTDEALTKAVLFGSAQIVASLGIMMQPFLPNTAKKIFSLLNMENTSWEEIANTHLLPEGHQINKAALLFSKIEDDFVAAQKEKLVAAKKAKEMENVVEEVKEFTPIKPEIQFDDFTKIDIRIGTILTAEKVKKADRLYHFTVDMGFETRSIVSGVAQHFELEDCIGKQVQVIVNLAPRVMKKIESQGMILFAEDSKGKLHFVSSDNIEAGSEVA